MSPSLHITAPAALYWVTTVPRFQTCCPHAQLLRAISEGEERDDDNAESLVASFSAASAGAETELRVRGRHEAAA
jgi:hypothetical protein